MVSGDPFSSVPTSANRNAFNPEFLNTNTSAAAMLRFSDPERDLQMMRDRWTLQERAGGEQQAIAAAVVTFVR